MSPTLALVTTAAPEVAPPPPKRKRRPAAYRPMSEPPPAASRPVLRDARAVWLACTDIAGADKEHFLCFDLDVRHRVIARRTVAIGTLCEVEVHPREVFRDAITNGAAAVILAHNHPSQDATPSQRDIFLTRRLRDVGELLGIAVLDHVVVCREGYVSIAEREWR